MRILVTCVLIALMAEAAWAAPVTLDARALLQAPGVVAVDPQNVTAVQFCDEVAWLAYKAQWLHAQVSSQDRRVLLLDATAQSGETALSVWVRNHDAPLQLAVRVSPTTLANHLYFVSCVSQRSAAQTEGSGAAATQRAPGAGGVVKHGPETQPAGMTGALSATWDAFVSWLSLRQWDLLTALVASPTAEAYAAFTASLSPQQEAAWATLGPAAHLAPPSDAGTQPATAAAPSARPAEAPVPSWLVWQARAARGNGDLLVAYTVTNTGNAEVVLDGARLQVLDAAGKPLPGVSVSRQDTSGFEGRVAPGGLESGVIRVPAASSDEVTVRWPVVEIGAGATYVLNAHLQATP
jgi:hypothetical protein